MKCPGDNTTQQSKHYHKRHYFRNASFARMTAKNIALHALKKSADKSDKQAETEA